MDNKILINVVLPAISEQIEVWVPEYLQFEELNDLIGEVATEATGGRFLMHEKLLLCEHSTGRPYSLTKTPRDLHLGNGAITMLI